MNLGQLREVFDNMEDKSFVFTEGFYTPHSYRGYYNELAFEPAANNQVRDIQEALEQAYTDAFTGYKGGTYEYSSTTSCHLSWIGEAGDETGDKLGHVVAQMVAEYNSRVNK